MAGGTTTSNPSKPSSSSSAMAGGTTTTANPSKPSSSSFASSHANRNNSKPSISSIAKSPAAAQHHHHHSQPRPSPRPPHQPPFHRYTDFLPPQPPLPPPSYGFHMLDRRTIVLSDGSVRSYFALPPDYHHFSPPPLSRPPPLPDLGFHDPLRFDPGVAGKRSRAEEEAVLFDKACKRQQVLQFGNHPDSRFPSSASGTATSAAPLRHLEVDPVALKKSFLHFAKVVNENAIAKRNYLENGKSGLIKCAACVIRFIAVIAWVVICLLASLALWVFYCFHFPGLCM